MGRAPFCLLSPRCAEYLLNPEGTLKKVGAQEPGQADQSVIHQGEEVLVGGVPTPRASMPVQRCNSARPARTPGTARATQREPAR